MRNFPQKVSYFVFFASCALHDPPKVPIWCQSAHALLWLLSWGSQQHIQKCRYEHRGPCEEIVQQTVLYCMFLVSLALNNTRKWWFHLKNRTHVTSVTHMATQRGGCPWETYAEYCPWGLGCAGEGVARRNRVGSVWDLMSLFDVYQVNDTLCLWHCLSLSHTSVCSTMYSPNFQSFTHPLILFLTLLLYFSLSLSLVCMCVGVRVRVPLSFFLSLSPLHSLSGLLSVFLFLHYTCTRAHAVTRSLWATHSQTHTRTKIFMPIFLAHSHTCLSLSLSFTLSLSLSLLHTYTDTHTHSHSHTLSLMNSLIHSFLLSRVSAVLSSARVRARALFSLLSVSLLLPPFLVCFLSDSISVVLFLPSSLASFLSLCHSFAFFFNSCQPRF